ncbi:MAG: inositol oxygenase family protein [Bryobacteraceae bacterium]
MGQLQSMEQWEDFVKDRYRPDRKKEEFRKFTAEAPAGVQEFYRLNHANQTHDFAVRKKREYGVLNRRRMSVWEAMEYLNTLVDESDPDTNLSQIEHLLQTSEALRRDGRPGWFILTGLIHDLGKILCLYGEPQWAVVGDTFAVGCAFSDKIVYPEFFAANPDSSDPRYHTPLGIYEKGCGLSNVDLSWGHDEYLYQVVKNYLPDEALYMIRYHSFYPWHKEGAYRDLMDDQDRKMLPCVEDFNPYDLYSKSESRPDVAAVKPFYDKLIAEYFPPTLNW